MEDFLKSRAIIIISVAMAILLIFTAASCNSARKLKLAHDQEMAKRLDSEEKLNKFINEKSAAEEKAGKLAKELEAEKLAREAAQKALEQEQKVNQNLKDELQKVNKLKEKLEENLKEALVTDKSAAVKVKK